MGDIDKLVKVVKLMAKTGLYFANSDGNYSQNEKDFLQAYVSGIEMIGTIDEEVKQSVFSTFDSTYTLEEIVNETEEVVDGFPAEDRGTILKGIKHFINKVIRLDDNLDSKEQQEYQKWKEALGVN